MVAISKLYPEVIQVCRPLIIEDEVLRILVRRFSESLTKGLNAQRAESSPVKCNLTYVTDFPDGTERGSFIGLDFSGRIFRLAYVELKGDRNCVSLSRLYEFPYQKLTESITKVVDYVARCVCNFIETYEITGKKIILGVTSSFPMQQECLQDGTILQWGKDFESHDRDNTDFFNLLKAALRRFNKTRGIYLISLINNSTACLLSGFYKDPGTRIGVYLGDETNVAYMEKFENMTTHTGDGLRTRTALAVEMKSFGDDGALDFLRTDFDFQIDAASPKPKTYVLDKMVAGAHLGEVARLYLYKLTSMGIILKGYLSPMLSMKDSLKTSDLAMMEMDEEDKFTRCRAVMRNLGYRNVSEEDCHQIRFVSRCVAKRSANLIAACLTALIHRMDARYVHILGDGYLLKEFPNYENYLNKKINQLKRSGYKFLLKKGDKDETTVGAGLVALIYKDGVIKAEDKRRVLPPANINKYNLRAIPTSVMDCECDAGKKRASNTTEKQKFVPLEKRQESSAFEFAVPLIANTVDFEN